MLSHTERQREQEGLQGVSITVELTLPSAADSLDSEADRLGVEVFLDVGGRHFGESFRLAKSGI